MEEIIRQGELINGNELNDKMRELLSHRAMEPIYKWIYSELTYLRAIQLVGEMRQEWHKIQW